MEEYFRMKEWNERNAQFFKDNYITFKERLQSSFNTVSTNVQKHSRGVIEAIKKETEEMLGYLKKMESDALSLLETAEAVVGGSKDSTEVQLEDYHYELPIGFMKNLPDILRSELQKFKDDRNFYVLEDIVFEPNENLSIGSVRVRLSEPDEYLALDCKPRVYKSQQIGARCITREDDCCYSELAFTLNPCGQAYTIADLWSGKHNLSTDDDTEDMAW